MKNLKGISQLYYNNYIFLCGSNEEEEIGSSNLISINLNKKISNDNSTVLINSNKHHYYPSMAITKELNLVVIGGKKEKSCEIYSIRSERWKEIDSLPNERFNCSLCYDKRSDYLYLFGGFDYNENIIHNNILRIYSKYFIQWEIISVSEGWNSNLLKRNSSLCFNGIDIGHIYLFGGKNEKSEFLNNLILFTFMKLKRKNSSAENDDEVKTIQNSVEEILVDEKFKETFCDSNSVCNFDKNTFFGIDDNLNLFYVFNKKDEIIPEIVKYKLQDLKAPNSKNSSSNEVFNIKNNNNSSKDDISNDESTEENNNNNNNFNENQENSKENNNLINDNFENK